MCVDLGKLHETSVVDATQEAIKSVSMILKDPKCIAVALEEQLACKFSDKSAVASKLFSVMGAVLACCMTMDKPCVLVSTQELKRHFGWRYIGGYNANKEWCKEKCKELFPLWFSKQYEVTDHACDAKLLAEYVKTRCYPNNNNNEQARGAQATGPTSDATRPQEGSGTRGS